MRQGERAGLAVVSSIKHDPRYHELHDLSSTIIVLVFRKLAYLFERFCKVKKTKGYSSLGCGEQLGGGGGAPARSDFQIVKIGLLAGGRVKSPRRKPRCQGHPAGSCGLM